MKNLFIAICVLVASQLTAQETEIKITDNFSEIKIYNKIQAQLIPSSENKIVATGFDKDDIDASVKNGVLKVKLGLDNIWSETDTQIKIYFSSVETIDGNEGSYVEIQDGIEQTTLTLKTQEGAEIIAPRLKVENLQIKSVTGGYIQTSGTATTQIVEIKTGGNYNGEDLETKTTDVNVKAGGNADVNATEYCKAKVSAGGNINIYGDTEKVDKKVTLGGNIKLK